MNVHVKKPIARRRTGIKRPSSPLVPLQKFIDPATLPNDYAMICEGKCLEPEILDGAKLHFSKVEKYTQGDFVIIWFKPELVKPGRHQALVKRLWLDVFPNLKFPYKAHPDSNVVPVIAAEMLNPPMRFFYPVTDILAVHKCMGVVS
jgi:hypothetical protein